jgi:hypothetical protein
MFAKVPEIYMCLRYTSFRRPISSNNELASILIFSATLWMMPFLLG